MAIAQLHPAETARWPAAAELLLLDVREAWELSLANTAHLSAYAQHHIPLGQLPQRWPELQALAAGRHIACLCHHGVRSMQAAYFLQHQGLPHVANISGGIAAWADFDPKIAHY